MPDESFAVGRWTLFAALAILTLHVCASEERHDAQHEQLERHRLRHRYRTSGAARDFREPQPRGAGLCSRCPPGFGVARRCTLVRDTVCHSCPKGYYAPGYSRKHSCWPCSRCGDGLYEAHPCTGTSDAICDGCRDPAAPGDAPGCRRFADSNSSRHNDNKGVAAPLTDPNDKSHRTLDDPSSGALRATTNGSTRETRWPPPPPPTSSSYSFADSSNEDEDVAVGVTQIVAFQIVLIFTTVAAILALTCRLRVFTNHETARFKVPESYRRDDGVALIEHLSGDS